MPYMQMMEDRLRFLNIDQDTLTELRNAKDILEPAMDEMLDRFYSHILGEPDLKALFADDDMIQRARSAQKKHWMKALFEGKYDNDYYEKTVQIGRAHARIGLTPNWYIGGYSQIIGQFIELISNKSADGGKPATRIIQAVSKIIFLDIDLVISCYLDAKDSTMRQILQRATDFRSDVWTLSDDLNTVATQIKSTAATLSDTAGGEQGSTTKSSAAESESGEEKIKHINELLALAEKLNLQTMQLDERLKKLPLSDKLYLGDDSDKSGWFARLIDRVSKAK